MELKINKINEKELLGKLIANYISKIKAVAAERKESLKKEATKNATTWAVMLLFCLGFALFCIFGLKNWMPDAPEYIVLIARFCLGLLGVLCTGLILAENPIITKHAIETEQYLYTNITQKLIMDTTIDGLLSITKKMRRENNFYRKIDNILFDLEFDLEMLDIFSRIMNNQLLSYAYDEEQEALFVTYADKDGTVHKDICVNCRIEYNINVTEMTLSFMTGTENCNILLTQPYVKE